MSYIYADKYDLFTKDLTCSKNSYVLAGNLCYISGSNLIAYQSIETENNRLDFIYYDEGGDDQPLVQFLNTRRFVKVKTGNIKTFSKEELYRISSVRIKSYHDIINGLPSFEW